MEYEVAFGTVTGRDHVHGLRNNQDALAVEERPEGIVAVVCDGCSSGAHSEVGAQLGARLIAAELAASLGHFNRSDLWYPAERARLNVLVLLRLLAKAMAGSFSQIVNDYFLFTIVAAVIGKERTIVMGIGDGMYAVNGMVTTIGPFANNAPPYLAYSLTGSSLADQRSELLQFNLYETMPTDALNSLMIGTDGVGDIIRARDRTLPGRTELVGTLDQFWESDRYFSENPFLLSRRLNQINPSQPVVRVREDGSTERFEGLLPDDTTLVVARRRKGA